ncbi:MAG TPA: amino acid adenylation domain-containing protein [Roseiflexaceae bacterium]|nr:amino acid adenylation domain-containing protein [Roseiflexaceae bacterium]
MYDTAIEGFRLSPLQHQIWLARQRHPSAPLGVRAAIAIEGPIDPHKLGRAWAQVCERHEILRTRFAALPGMDVPLQVIGADNLPPLHLDGRALPDGAIEQVEATLEQLAPTSHRLHIALPAPCADRASLAVLLADLAHAYARGPLAPPDDPAPQYVDLSEWQHELLEAEETAAGREFWREQRRAAPQPPALPWAAASDDALADIAVSVPLAADTAARLGEAAARANVAPATLLLAAWQLLLARSTGATELLIGVLADGRTYDDLRGACGLLARYLPLRASLSPALSFARHAEQVEQDLQIATGWQECFVAAEEAAGWQFGFEYAAAPAPVPTADAIFALASGRVRIAPVTLQLTCVERDGALEATVDYDGQALAHTAAAHLAEQFAALLAALLERPDQAIGAAPLLSADQREELLRLAWTPALKSESGAATLHDQIARHAATIPTATAVVAPDRSLTYAELHEQASALARRLREHGVGAERPVAVCLPRTAALAVSMVAVMQAGGVYVPLDPAQPPERLARLVAATAPAVVLADQTLLAALAGVAAPVLAVEALLAAPDTGGAEAPAVLPDQLAYIIYTSGSTGAPKGVGVAHRQLAHYTRGAVHRLNLPARASYAVVSTFAADLGLTAVFAALWSGGALHIIEEGCARTPDAFGRYMREHAVDCLKIVPAHLGALLESADPAAALPRQRLVLGGEALRPELLARVHTLAPECRVLNHYGPTETTVGTLTYDLSNEGVPAGAATVPLGRPLPGSEVYVLDASGEPVPFGVIGEIYIGGPGVARGYIGQPGLTADRFVPHPHSSTPGARLYRTGDRARLHPNGAVEFVGRGDDQVKLRGYRVELGEIAAALREHPAVRDAVAIVRGGGDQLRLLAYVEPHAGATTSPQALGRALEQQLPAHMLPDAIVVLPQLPLNANGKINRQALPEPEAEAAQVEYVAPRTPAEATLAEIWAQVLGREQIGVNDNFFALGGHSLRAMQIVSKASAALGREVSINQLFAHPTVAALAEALGEAAPARPAAAPTSPSSLTSLERPHRAVVERRPLLPVLLTKRAAPVDAVALGPVPRTLQAQSGMSRDDLIRVWCDDLPTLKGILDTPLGRIGGITLPVLTSEVYDDQDRLVREIIGALEIAGALGVRVVSLTGLLPSATNYGEAVVRALGGRTDLPALSTGHATTTTAVVLAIRRIAEEAGRDLRGERVAFLGLGSVGTATLRLMLQCLPHPREIALCDVYSKLAGLEALAHELKHTWGYRGTIRILEAQTAAPPQIYESTLIVGATNVSNILDVARLQPGTLLVDDSAPHCFDPAEATARFEERGDILFTEGGVLRSPAPIGATKYLPQMAEAHMDAAALERFAQHDPWHIMGCVFSGLLSTRYPELTPTVGMIDPRAASQHYARLDQLGFQAARLHCEHYVLPETAIAAFRRRFGGEE